MCDNTRRKQTEMDGHGWRDIQVERREQGLSRALLLMLKDTGDVCRGMEMCVYVCVVCGRTRMVTLMCCCCCCCSSVVNTCWSDLAFGRGRTPNHTHNNQEERGRRRSSQQSRILDAEFGRSKRRQRQRIGRGWWWGGWRGGIIITTQTGIGDFDGFRNTLTSLSSLAFLFTSCFVFSFDFITFVSFFFEFLFLCFFSLPNYHVSVRV